MIELITGIPSSGKTYFAASKMLEVYKSKKRLIYTNINLHVNYDDYIQPLDIPDLYKFASKEFKLFDKFNKLSNDYKKKLDDDLYSLQNNNDLNDDSFSKYYGNYDLYLKDSGLLDTYGGSYIFWDECHNDLNSSSSVSSADPIWIRFLSYHRHFNIDIILVTQDISLVHRKYRPFIAKFYYGQNPAKRLTTTTLKYKVYTDSREFDKFYIETVQLPMKKEVFDFYDSGEYSPEKSLLLKKLFPAFLLILSISLAVYLFINQKESSLHSTSASHAVFENNISDLNNSDDFIDDTDSYDFSSHIVFFNCDSNICVLKNSSFTIPLNYMQDFISFTNSKALFVNPIFNNYIQMAVSVSDSLYNDILTYNLKKRGDRHENNKMDFSSSVSRL